MTTTDETTTITAIVTQEDGAYCVYFATACKNMLGVLADDRWFETGQSPFSNDLDAAKAYADRVVRLEVGSYDREMMTTGNRINAGNYQGCWNAPIIYRTWQRHTGWILE